MLSGSFFLVILGIILHKSNAVDVQKLCAGQRYGTLVPNPNDCNSFYVCQFVVQLTQCDIGLHFDRKNKVCNWPQFAGCDWVEPEGSPSEDKVPAVKPEKPNTNDDKNPVGPTEQPNNPLPAEEQPLPSEEINKPLPAEEQPLPSEEDNVSKPSQDSGKPNEDGESKPSEEGNVIQPPEDITPEDAQNSKESEESKLDNAVTENDVLTAKPQYPSVDPSNSSEENHDNQQNHPSTDHDVIIGENQTASSSPEENMEESSTVVDGIVDQPQTSSPSSAENPPNVPPTVDDMITQTPFVSSAESGEPTPDFPKPNHPERPPPPPINEDTDQQPSEENQDSSEKDPSIEGDKPDRPKPPNIDENVTEPDLPFAGDHNSHHWNIIASIVSVETSHKDGFINHPTVGAHSPETGYPVDVMTGYDPNNVQCLHSGLYFLPHPTNCQKYFICAYSHLHLHSCGNDVIWNHKREQCDLKGYARCYTRDAESEDSTELATPFIDDQTEKITRKTTKPPTRRSTSKSTTIQATTLSHKLPICPRMRQAYMPNLDDCHKYFICIMGKPVLTSCPSAMHWDAVGEFCGEPSVVRCAHR